MDKFFTMQDFQTAADAIRQRTRLQPKVGLILDRDLTHLRTLSKRRWSFPTKRSPTSFVYRAGLRASW
jgi:hypothetical protein